MKHTAQSLGKYIGNRVHLIHSDTKNPYSKKPCKGILLGVDAHANENVQILRDSGVIYMDFFYKGITVYPVLKTYEKLLEPMMFEGKWIVPIEYVYRITDAVLKKDYSDRSCLYSKIFGYYIYSNFYENESNFDGMRELSMRTKFWFDLLAIGFGAVKNDQSSTGYVSVFDGLECEVEK